MKVDTTYRMLWIHVCMYVCITVRGMYVCMYVQYVLRLEVCMYVLYMYAYT